MSALVLALTVAALAQEPAPVQPTLSSGQVLLLSNAEDPAKTSDALRAALLSTDIGTRLAAARVIAVIPHGELRGPLIGALAREQSAFAAAEMIRDLLTLSGAADVDTVEPQVRRVGGDAVVALAEWLARERPDQFLARQAEFLTSAPSRRVELLRIAGMASAQHPADAERIRSAWATGPIGPSRASTMESIGPGVVTSTLAAAKCAIDRGNVAIVDLTYADNGRPTKVSIDPTGLSSGCQAAWTALARTTLARWQQPALPDTVETVLMPLSTQFIRCADQRGDVAETADIARASANVERPRKTKDVPPTYPQGAMKARIEGTVFVDAMIDKSGCVSQGRVTHSIPGLDLAALYAVTQWVFEPAKRDGQPVPVYMTVTVRFTLR